MFYKGSDGVLFAGRAGGLTCGAAIPLFGLVMIPKDENRPSALPRQKAKYRKIMEPTQSGAVLSLEQKRSCSAATRKLVNCTYGPRTGASALIKEAISPAKRCNTGRELCRTFLYPTKYP